MPVDHRTPRTRAFSSRCPGSAAALLFVCLCGGALAGCAQQPDGCSLELATSLPLKLMVGGTKLAVPATLKGAEIMLMLDTGSQVTMLDGRAADATELALHIKMTGFGGTSEAGTALFSGLQIGRLHGPIPAVNGHFGAAYTSQGLQGQLGMDVVGNYDVDLDLSAGQMRLYTAQGACRSSAVTMAQPLYSDDLLPAADDLRPHVPVRIAGQTFTAVIDTGSTGMTIPPAAARLLGLTEDVLQIDPIVGIRGVGPALVKARVHMMESVTLGNLTLRHIPAFVVPAEVGPPRSILLGVDLAKMVHLWISRSSQRLVMQYPPSASPTPAATVP